MTSLKESIRKELVADATSVLTENIDEVKRFLSLFQDGTISLRSGVRSLSSEDQILVYLIGQQYAFEADLVDTPVLETSFFYERFNQDDSTIRHYLKSLRDDGLSRKNGRSGHEIVVENIPIAIERIRSSLKE